MSATVKVKNNHTGALPIAGVSVSAGREAVVDAKAFRIFKRSEVGKTWMGAGFVEVVEAKAQPKPEPKAEAKTAAK